MISPIWITLIGFLAQFCFSARILFQWIRSEKEKKLSSPTIYWVFSVIGSWVMFLYGCLRNDFAIIFGQLISYYIYLWNLNLKGHWKSLNVVLKVVLVLTPVVATAYLFKDIPTFVAKYINSEANWLVVFGTVAQVIFALRFVWQWFVTLRTKESSLPLSFWLISVLGSGMIIIYALFRHDIVLILGQAFGFAVYCRNVWIGLHLSKKC